MRLVTLALAALVVGCDAAPAPAPAGDLSGAYGYLARKGGADVVAGTVQLLVQDDSSITGTWALQRVPGSDTSIAVGPQLGTGTLHGHRTASGLWLDLNPGWADNNVFLALLAEPNTLAGTWDHSTIIGPVTGGPVHLHRLVR
jgi:hypothetical protein